MARKKRKIVEVEIKDSLFPNRSIGEYEDEKLVIKGGIKGQRVKVALGKRRKDYIEGKIIEVVERSPLERNLQIEEVDFNGGCLYASLLYPDELRLKEDQILRLFNEEGFKDINYLGIEGSPITKGYRNKMEYSFGDEVKDGPLILGLHKQGQFYSIVDSDGHHLVDRDFTKIRKAVMKYFRDLNASYYRKRSHEGFLRHFIIRKALSTGEIMLNLVTSSQDILDKKNFLDFLLNIKNLKGDIVGILHTTNDGLADTVQADKLDLLYGKDYIVEEILGLRFKISPFSFFQTNTFGAEKLYSIVREFVGDIEDKIVFDLYSGTGTIAQIMAPLAKKVIGIEIVEEAVNKAIENAKENNLDNIDFIAGDVLQAVDNLDLQPDLIIIDPPRDGIHPKAINKIIDFSPETFAYVSCNPVTLVRDLKVFEERGYKIDKMKLMDMFPRTANMEVVTLLTRSEASCK